MLTWAIFFKFVKRNSQHFRHNLFPFVNFPFFRISPLESLYIVRFCWVSYTPSLMRFLFPPHSIARKLKYIAQVVWYKEIRTEPKNGTKTKQQQRPTNKTQKNTVEMVALPRILLNREMRAKSRIQTNYAGIFRGSFFKYMTKCLGVRL